MKKLICLVAMLFAVTNAFALPKGYTELEYIESTGTQYIDTGFSPDANTSIDYKGQLLQYVSSVPLFGSRVGGNNTERFLPLAFSTRAGLGRTVYGSLDVTFDLSTSTVYTGSFRPSEGKSIINGVVYDISGGVFQKTENNNIYLFATSGYGNQLYNSTGRIWYVKIYQKGALVHNLVPAKNSSGVVGMYDTVKGEFLINRGSGAFTAGPGIRVKIATKKYNENVFAPVSQTLAGLRSNISDIVDDVYAQATDIADLNSQKQTRPATGCPAGKKCLLVKTPAGQNAWYEIADCGEDMFLSNVGSNVTFGGTYYGGYKDGSTAERACAASGANCANNSWMRSFANGAVYGEAIRLSVSQQEGTVVTLPSGTQNDPNGRNCLCRATGYRLKNGNSYGSLVAVSTDKWYIAHGTARNDHTCQHNCAFDGDQQPDGGIDVPYYAAISNTCGGSVASAAMCTYNQYLMSILEDHPLDGDVAYKTCTSSECLIMFANSSSVDTQWCNTANDVYMSGTNDLWPYNTWASRLPTVTATSTEIANGDANVPVLYGRAYCTDMNVNTAAYTMLTEEQIGTKYPRGIKTNSNGQNTDALACVCQLKGYKNNADSAMTTIQGSKYIYTGWSEVKCYQGCQQICAETFRTHVDNNLMWNLANTCDSH